MKLRHMPILRQQAVVIFSVCLVVFGLLIATLNVMSSRAATRQAEDSLQQQVAILTGSVGDTFTTLQDSAKTRIELYKRMLPGSLMVGSQTLPAGEQPAVPVIQAGTVVLNGNMALLEKIRDTLDGEPAVMVRQNDQFIRVATFLKNAAGKSQVGVPLPADGPETAALKAGKTYIGLIVRNGKYYMSVFEPVMQNGQAAGAISIRIAIDHEMQRLNQRIASVTVGKNGYAYVVEPGKELLQSRMLVHPVFQGKTLREIGNEALNEIVRREIEQHKGLLRYEWTDPKSQQNGTKIVAFAPISNANWIVVAGSWEDEFLADARHLRNTTTTALILASLVIVASLLLYTKRGLLQQLGGEPAQVQEVMQKLAQGDLKVELQTRPGDNSSMMAAIRDMVATLSKVISETQHVVQAAGHGDLGQRVPLQDKQGYALELGQGINQMAQTSGEVMGEVREVLAGMAEGDLCGRVHSRYQGEYGVLAKALNDSLERLAFIISEVRSTADSITGASGQVAATAQALSQATTEQSASLEQTTASMEQMSASINQNTENAKVTDGIAKQSSDDAIRVGEAARGALDAMRQIAERIGIIDDIAYRTDLLALNAAIEAARAGEHGMGFAVVAAEVRKLAERSQIAAQEIGELASNSVKITEDAGALLQAMLPSIQKTADLVREITFASNEQTSGAGQINNAMNQLNQITQQNAAGSEELAATAEEMSALAEQLQGMVDQFKLRSA